MINNKLIDLAIKALENGHTLEQIMNFFYTLDGMTIETTETKTIIMGEKTR